MSGTKRDYSMLREIGLSKLAVSLYQNLANDGPAKTTMLAKRMKLRRNGLYRVLERLTEQGFVHKSKFEGFAAVYSAKPLHQAIEGYFKYQRRQIRPLLGGYEEFVKGQNKIES